MRIRVACKKFTASNTGLDKASQYPELSSTFKAAFVKSSMWFFAKMAIQISENHPEESRSNKILFKVYMLKPLFSNLKKTPHVNVVFHVSYPYRTTC